MTKEEVLKTSWGEPKYIDHGGTSVSKNNKKEQKANGMNHGIIEETIEISL